MPRETETGIRSQGPLWLLFAAAVFILVGFGLWNHGESEFNRSEVSTDPTTGEAHTVRDETGLLPLDETTRHTQESEAAASETEARLATEIDDPNDGWGHVHGTASINGLPLEVGKLHWYDPSSGEQGYSPIEAGNFGFDAPVGEITVTAWVVSHNGITVPNHDTNGVDNLTRVQSITVLDAKPSPLSIEWLYDEVRVEGDVRTVPSQTPVAGVQLYIFGIGPECTVHAETDSAGYFSATVPAAPELSVSVSFGRTSHRTPVLKGWTELRIPDAHNMQVIVRDGRSGKEISDYDFFFRESSDEWKPYQGWKRLRVGGQVDGASKPTTEGSANETLALPAGRIDLFVYAPRLGLAPYRQAGLAVGPGSPHIDVTLQPGGALAFTCENPPPTGLVNPGYDPDPIMVVEEYMYHWNEPDVQAFGGHVDREGAIPRNLLFTRRLNFNLQGEALVKGLPAGTYRVMHWRSGVNWRSEPLEVLPGVTTHVQLTAE